MEGLEIKVSHTDGYPCLHDRAPIQAGYQGSSKLPYFSTFHAHRQTLLLGEKGTVHVAPLAGFWNLAHEDSWTLLYVPDPLTDFNLHPFTVQNHKHECNSFFKNFIYLLIYLIFGCIGSSLLHGSFL